MIITSIDNGQNVHEDKNIKFLEVRKLKMSDGTVVSLFKNTKRSRPNVIDKLDLFGGDKNVKQ